MGLSIGKSKKMEVYFHFKPHLGFKMLVHIIPARVSIASQAFIKLHMYTWICLSICQSALAFVTTLKCICTLLAGYGDMPYIGVLGLNLVELETL